MCEDGASRKLGAEVMNERFVRKAVETIAANTGVEVALGER
jgi:hypothetical protein